MLTGTRELKAPLEPEPTAPEQRARIPGPKSKWPTRLAHGAVRMRTSALDRVKRTHLVVDAPVGPSVAGGDTAIARPLGSVAQALEQLQEEG